MKLYFSFVPFLLSGCVFTPPGQLTDEDFDIKKYTIDIPIEDVIKNFSSGLRYCGPQSDGTFISLGVTNHGIPVCPPNSTSKKFSCDLYGASGYGGRSDIVLGRVDFLATKNGTNIELRAQTWIPNSEETLTSWEKFISNKAEEACPGPPPEIEDDFAD